MDWKQLLSTLLGGAMALLGSVITHHLTARRDNARRADEEKTRALRDLKMAYVSWLQNFTSLSARLAAWNLSAEVAIRMFPDGVVAGFDELLAHAVILQEPNAEARLKIRDLVQAYASASSALRKLKKDQTDEAARVLGKLGAQGRAFEDWLIDVRFAGRPS